MGLLQLMLPKRCYACETLLNYGEIQLCTSCRHSLPILTPVMLQYYIKQFNFERHNINHFNVLFLFEKHSTIQKIIHKLKYKQYRHMGKMLAHMQLKVIESIHRKAPIDYLIPIPIHKKRHRERGYNQLEKYAEVFSKVLQIPIRNDVLIKKKHHQRLATLNYTFRAQQIRHSFQIQNASYLKNKHVLILDDIITTGATINEVIDTLTSTSNCKISVACMAFTKPED